MKKKTTIKEIAEIVGVSKATVSYYLNGNYKKMSFETKKKIENVINKTGYQPSKIAQSLVTQNTKTIGVVIADITNPFISSVMKGIHDTCKDKGYTVNFTNSDNDINIEIENINRLKQQNISGIILDSVDANHPFIKTLDPKDVVMIDRQSDSLWLDTIVSNNKSSTRAFLQKMKQSIYDCIYFVSYPVEGISTRELRYQAFKEEISDDSERLIIINKSDSKEKIKEIISNKMNKNAFFTMNGPVLLDFIQIVNETEYEFPKDFGLGSYEDLEWMQVVKSPISCIRQNSYQIGKVACKHLINKLVSQNYGEKPQLIEVKNKIILRSSF